MVFIYNWVHIIHVMMRNKKQIFIIYNGLFKAVNRTVAYNVIHCVATSPQFTQHAKYKHHEILLQLCDFTACISNSPLYSNLSQSRLLKIWSHQTLSWLLWDELLKPLRVDYNTILILIIILYPLRVTILHQILNTVITYHKS